MPDYDADCLWDDVTGVMVPKSDVPLSESLKCGLTAWRKRWEELAEGAWHRDEDTREDAAWADHQRDERKLWMALREELGSDFEVGLAVPSPGGPQTRGFMSSGHQEGSPSYRSGTSDTSGRAKRARTTEQGARHCAGAGPASLSACESGCPPSATTGLLELPFRGVSGRIMPRATA